jgi:AcrR family transcriptional regulator
MDADQPRTRFKQQEHRLPATAQSPQWRRRMRTRAALIRAGADLLAERPIDAIPVNDIVDAAGVAKGSFFNHFEDKDAFAAEIAAGIREDLEARVTAANKDVADPAARVARGIATFVEFAVVEPKRTRIMLRGHEWATSGAHRLNAGIQADVQAGVASGRFLPRAEGAGVAYLIGVCLMALLATVDGRPGPAASRDQASRLLILALAGLGLEEDDARDVSQQAVAGVLAAS